MANDKGGAASLRDALRVIVELEERLARVAQREREPIAIVGMAERFPGGSPFWQTLLEGRDASSQVPADRWDADAYYDPDPRTAGKAITKRAAFVGDVQSFDAPFFKITPLEAQAMDPQQRLALEVAWEALEDAALPRSNLGACRTGVFMGVCAGDYRLLCPIDQLPEPLSPYGVTGTSPSVISGRISYALGLSGPSLVVDTACSSSLVALHLACESLRLRESDVALAGGVNFILSPATMVGLSKVGALSPDGRCKAFDASGNGFGRGEGCGVVVTKRMSDAIRDGDRIYALVRGSAINQDGRSDGLTAPSGWAQQQVIRDALAFARMKTTEVQYVEAHGTGTVLGDPIEVEALAAVFGEARGATAPLVIGTVKSNIGHLEGAAGVAGVIKTVRAILHRQIPPSIHLRTPNPHIPWESIPVRVQTALGPWPAPEAPLVAGVSSFGISGTNAHAIIAEPPKEDRDAWAHADALAQAPLAQALALSAATPAALRAVAERFAAHLEALEAPQTWRDVGFTACVRRTHLDHRLVVTGSSAATWASRLREFVRGESPKGVRVGRARHASGRAVFVFSGQGSQWWRMGRELYAEDATYRAAVERCAAIVDGHVSWRLLEELLRDESSSRLAETEIAQPALFALQVGLCEVWKAWGIEPHAVVGHSVGEIAAAHVAGALTLENAARLAVARGRVMQKATGLGKMAAVALSAGEAEELAAEIGDLEVAASNGPRASTLSGTPEAVASAIRILRLRGVECTELRVDHAFHSAPLAPLARELIAAVGDLDPRRPGVRMISTSTGDVAPTLDAAYWGHQMRGRVRFYEATKALLGARDDAFIEIGPHPVLLPAIDATLEESGKKATLVASLRRKEPERESLLQGLGALHAAGYPVTWSKVFAARGRVVSLPSYPWERERYWIEDRRAAPAEVHPLLGRPLTVSTGSTVFENEIDTRKLPYLLDHRVRGTIVFPGAGYVEMALAAGRHALGERPLSLRRVAFIAPLALKEGERKIVQTVLGPEEAGELGFSIASETSPGEWTQHAHGAIAVEAVGEPPEEAPRASSGTHVDAKTHYEKAAAFGLEYGVELKRVAAIVHDGHRADATLLETEAAARRRSEYVLDPTLLDACIQVFASTFEPSGSKVTLLPVGIRRLRVWRAPAGAGTMTCRVRRVSAEDAEVEGAFALLDAAGRVVADAEGVRVQRIEERSVTPAAQITYGVAWTELPREPAADLSPRRVLVLTDTGGFGEELCRIVERGGGTCVRVVAGKAYGGSAGHFAVDPTAPDGFQRILREALGGKPCTDVVHTWSLDIEEAATAEELVQRQDLGCIAALHLVQALVRTGWREMPRLWLATRGAQPEGLEEAGVAQSPLWGFGATVATELPELGCTLLDLDPRGDGGALALALYEELLSAAREQRVLLRGGRRLVARLRKMVPAGRGRRRLVVGRQGYALTSTGAAHALELREIGRTTPGPHEVEIRVRAAGVDVRDVRMASDPHTALGSECAGIVTAVGEEVTSLRVGEEVVAVAKGALRAYVTTPAALAIRKPEALGFEAAAAMPIAFATALHALGRVARLEAGERVLVHPAASGLGLAAIHHARHLGARILATARDDEERRLLRAAGVDHVADAGAPGLSDEIMAWTGGAGVDVVVSTHAGWKVNEAVGLLARYGRFVELGAGDRAGGMHVGVLPSHKSLSFAAVDVAAMMVERPDKGSALLQEVVELHRRGVFPALPWRVFPIANAEEAFAELRRGHLSGKVVIATDETVEIAVSESRFAPDGTYLVSGGLGGLGLKVAQWMAERGAGHLALLGRSAPSAEAAAAVRTLEATGARVHVLRGDVGRLEDVRAALGALAGKAPPLRGVIHCAGVVDDGTLMSLERRQFASVFAPKVAGAFNLHQATRDEPLDSFLMFSSAAGIIGAPGQANYAAANAYLDAFARAPRGGDVFFQSIDWGPWAEVGLAVRTDAAAKLRLPGVRMLEVEEALDAMDRLVVAREQNPTVIAFDFRQWAQFHPRSAHASFFAQVAEEAREDQSAGDAGHALREKLQDRSPAERVALLDQLVRDVLRGVLGTSMDDAESTAPFAQLGVDSLSSLELRNRIETTIGMRLSSTQLWNYPTIAELSRFLVDQLVAPTAVEVVVAAAPALDAKDLEALGELSEEEAAGLLGELELETGRPDQ